MVRLLFASYSPAIRLLTEWLVVTGDGRWRVIGCMAVVISLPLVLSRVG